MIPIITIVGHSNVGKSTLFNRLTRTRDALVADFPGLTRDRKYGYVKWKEHTFIVVDTGAIDGADNNIEKHMVSQSMIAIKEAHIVLLIVDGYIGPVISDKEIATYLRCNAKNTIIVINKTDGININNIIGEFYSLGIKEIIPIAALYGYGVGKLLKRIIFLLIKHDLFKSKIEYKIKEIKKEDLLKSQKFSIKLAVVGRSNVGKSTLINNLLGEERMIVYDMPGTTRDSVNTLIQRGKNRYTLIDTAGVRKRNNLMKIIEKFSVIKTFQSIQNADVVLLIIDAYECITDQDLLILNFIINSGRSLVIAVNKWDKLDFKLRNKAKEILKYRLSFIDFIRIHFISALYGNGVENLLHSVNEAYTCANKHINTALLTKIMRTAVNNYNPPLIHGRRAKLKYAHFGGYNPLSIIIHGTKVKKLPSSYKQYLVRYFRRSLAIIGTPICLQFNENYNPFIQRKKN